MERMVPCMIQRPDNRTGKDKIPSDHRTGKDPKSLLTTVQEKAHNPLLQSPQAGSWVEILAIVATGKFQIPHKAESHLEK